MKKKDFTFGIKLNQLMVERELYPADIERLTGIRRTRVYDYVQGTHQPSAYAVKKIALGLNVSSDWLLGLTEEI